MKYIYVRAKFWGYPSDDTWGELPTGNTLVQLREFSDLDWQDRRYFSDRLLDEWTLSHAQLWDYVEQLAYKHNIRMPDNLANIIFQARGVKTLKGE